MPSGGSSPLMGSATPSPPRRVAVIGAGAAGMAAAWSLTRHPSKFAVEVWEKAPQAGGVATSEALPGTPDEDFFINDGVQGTSSSYRNVDLLLASVGLATTPVAMKVSFGKGSTAWNNYGETPFIARHGREIKRFGRVLRVVSALEPLFIFVPMWLLLKLLCFSESFVYGAVFPLTALFFGTGNQTPRVAAAIFARVFLDPHLRLFDYDPKLLLSQQPRMAAFPKLSAVYAALVAACPAAVFRFNAPVTRIQRVKPSRDGRGGVILTDSAGATHEYDELIMACDAETSLRLLGTGSSWWERRVLGSVRYYDDVTVTHTDVDYMQRLYEIDFTRNDQYFVRSDASDPAKIEMSFDLSNYQPQLQARLAKAGGEAAAAAAAAAAAKVDEEGAGVDDPIVAAPPHVTVAVDGAGAATSPAPAPLPASTHIFQTIFLDKATGQGVTWTMDAINPAKVLLVKWWRQFAHSWSHYARVVPWVRFLQGKRHTWYAGSWTLVNTHEVAVVSGFAAAARLGAPYPFADGSVPSSEGATASVSPAPSPPPATVATDHDNLAKMQFATYMKYIHGVKVK